MKIEIGDIVYYTFKSEFRGNVKVRATVMDIYSSFSHGNSFNEMSIRYEDLGDTITEHCIPIDSNKIEK